MEKKYRAEFPMIWGDMATRVYNSKGVAIREAKKHLKAYDKAVLCSNGYCKVWEVDMTTHKATLIYEADCYDIANGDL